MYRTILLLFLALVAFAAEDPWAKVKGLKTGAEIRVYKTGTKQPLIAKMDELTDTGLVVIVKNEQVGIDRDDIERIDARPDAKNSRVRNESRTTTDLPDPVGPRPSPGASGVPGRNSSSSVSMGSKPDFETVYRRTAATPPPATPPQK